MSKKHYSEIYDIPLFNWEKCIEGRYEFMRVERIRKYDESDIKAFLELFDKYLKHRGLTKNQLEYLEKQKIYIEFAVKFLETGSQAYLTQMAITEIEMNDLNPTKYKGVSIGATVVTLSKWMSTWIDKKKVTLEDYLVMLDEFEKEHKVKK